MYYGGARCPHPALFTSASEQLGSLGDAQGLTRVQQPLNARHFVVNNGPQEFFGLLVILNLINGIGERL